MSPTLSSGEHVGRVGHGLAGAARRPDLGRPLFLECCAILEQEHGDAAKPSLSQRLRQSRQAAAMAIADLDGRSAPALGISARTVRRRRALARRAVHRLLEASLDVSQDWGDPK
jgi:hypothetical protein